MLKYFYYLFILFILSIGTAHAGCGSCNVSKNKAEKPNANFVIKINDDGMVYGLVLASCGMCNFGMNNQKCSLAIKINEKAYNVEGTNIDDHGDSHAKDGFCNAIRVAKVSGKIKNDSFFTDNFALHKHQ